MKPDLVIRWSKRESALLYSYQNNAAKALGSIVSGVLEREEICSGKRTLAQELEARGYDLTTLRFSIRKKVGT